MQRLKPDLDIVLDILKAVLAEQPDSEFTRSLHHQYLERGGLSKKQLQGLYGKASRLRSLPERKLATLEAIIKRKPLKEKSVLPETTPLYHKDEAVGSMIDVILSKYPQHKRVLYFKNKYENNEVFTAAEMTELKKFAKLLT